MSILQGVCEKGQQEAKKEDLLGGIGSQCISNTLRRCDCCYYSSRAHLMSMVRIYFWLPHKRRVHPDIFDLPHS